MADYIVTLTVQLPEGKIYENRKILNPDFPVTALRDLIRHEVANELVARILADERRQTHDH